MIANRRIRRNDSDPTFRGRIDRAVVGDVQFGRTTAEQCPEISGLDEGSIGRGAIIAVHGTMACAVPLARCLTELMSGRGPIVRFEHDTWNRVQDNAKELVNQIRRVGLDDVLFVAHSRGGLVARVAIGMLREEAPDVASRLIAVGTPFEGTQLVGAAESGLLGVRATLGAIRLLTGPVLDGVSRLAGMLIKGRLPIGIAQMHPDDGLFAGFAGSGTFPITGIAGFVDPNGAAESYGIAASARRGFSDAVFQEGSSSGALANDYVVPTASALSRVDESTSITVESDHFSYFLNQDVRRILAEDPWRADEPPRETLTF